MTLAVIVHAFEHHHAGDHHDEHAGDRDVLVRQLLAVSARGEGEKECEASHALSGRQPRAACTNLLRAAVVALAVGGTEQDHQPDERRHADDRRRHIAVGQLLVRTAVRGNGEGSGERDRFHT